MNHNGAFLLRRTLNGKLVITKRIVGVDEPRSPAASVQQPRDPARPLRCLAGSATVSPALGTSRVLCAPSTLERALRRGFGISKGRHRTSTPTGDLLVLELRLVVFVETSLLITILPKMAWFPTKLSIAFTFLVLTLGMLKTAVAEEDDRPFLTLSDCVERGFHPTRLSCAACPSLAEGLGNDLFLRDCNQCCRNDELYRFAPFHNAKLVASKQAGGGVQEFLEKTASRFEDVLDVEEAYTSEPRVILTKKVSASGSTSSGGSSAKKTVKVEFKVSSWKTEHIEELLRTYVKGANDGKD
jgi:hypothetical protein